jgi:hypothetical protein
VCAPDGVGRLRRKRPGAGPLANPGRLGLRLADHMSSGVAMNPRGLIVIGEERRWCVRLDGVEVVSFFGPHAEEWAVREREELAQLLDAQPHGDSSKRLDRAHRF